MDALNKYFLKTNMQTMRQFGLNMAFMIKSILSDKHDRIR